MGVFGAFFGRRGVVGFSGALFGVSSGVVGFIVAMFLRAAREKVRPARLVGGDSGTKFALLGQNLPNWAFLGEQGEFYRSSPVEWCNRFVSFGLGYALSWSGVSSCWVGCGVSRDLVRMSRLR